MRLDVYHHWVDGDPPSWATRMQASLDSLAIKDQKIMTKLDDLNEKITELTTDYNAFATGVQGEVTELQAEIAALQAANPGVDLSGPIDALTTLDATIKAAIGAIPPAPTV